MSNVFLGEPSDSVISNLDKRYYKHTVDAMNIDIAECYSVCETKGATIPSEKTSQNLPSTIESIKGGYTSGDLDVPVTGNITGVDSCGYSVTGTIFGSVHGMICGSVGYGCGTAIDGYIYGNIGSCGSYVGVCGYVYGDVCGIYGSVNGDIGYDGSYAGVCGSIHGDVGGNIEGSVSGNVFGSVKSVTDVSGDVYGSVGGSIYSGVCGDVCGSCGIPFGINGTIYPYYGFSSAYIDTDSSCGAFSIYSCGTTWWVHLV